MQFFSSLKEKISYIRSKLKGGSLENLIWLVNLVPEIVGFPLRSVKFHPLFWIIHMFLLFYTYGVGISVFLVFHAQKSVEFIQSFVNLSLFILITNNSIWFLHNRSLVKSVLDLVQENNELVSEKFAERRHKLLSSIMTILVIFYGFTYIEEIFIYTPNRADVRNTYGMTPCAGLEPLSKSPNREICMFLLSATEVTINIVCLNYQALLCLFIAHTAAMFQLLSDEINQLNEIDDDGNDTDYTAIAACDKKKYVKERLRVIIHRHRQILETIENLKSLYSIPIGINFISNAFCIMLFFLLSFDEYVAFVGVLVYCYAVFFLYCFFCQRLINASEEFERAVYNCGWENFEVAEKQIIYNVLVSAQRQVELLAANIVPVNIATFATTCQAMYKFVTVVKL